MMDKKQLQQIAGEQKLNLSMLEKDYVLGWLLFGITSSSISGKLVFKGGTALSKVYFAGNWRLSEDLDFTIVDGTDWAVIIESLKNEIPEIVKKAIGISVSLRPKTHTNKDYLQAKIKYQGPMSANTIKVEITREKFVGDVVKKQVPVAFDYQKFSVNAYSLETLVAEKIRAIMERGYVRDYYDVWRLLKTAKPDKDKTKDLFLQKCKAKELTYTGIEQFFPKDIVKKLEDYVEVGLGRLSRESLPPLQTIIDELKELLSQFLK